MSSRTRAPLFQLGMGTALAAALLFAVEPAQAQAPPGSRPPSARPWHNHDRSNIPPRPRPGPPHGHDRSNIPPRANPNPPGQGNPHGPSDPAGPAEPGSRGEANGRGNGNGNGSENGNGRGNGARKSLSPAGIAAALQSGTLTAPSGQVIAPGAQRALLSLVKGSHPGADRAVAEGLAPAENARARAEASRLAANLDGLLERPEELHGAVVAYNALVDASADGFLRAPSPEFLAVQSVLDLLVEDSFAGAPAH